MNKILESYLTILKENQNSYSVKFFLWRKSSPSNAWEKSDSFKIIKKFLRSNNIPYTKHVYEEEPDIFTKHKIKMAPCTLIFKNGTECDRVGGMIRLPELKKWLGKC